MPVFVTLWLMISDSPAKYFLLILLIGITCSDYTQDLVLQVQGKINGMENSRIAWQAKMPRKPGINIKQTINPYFEFSISLRGPNPAKSGVFQSLVPEL